MKIPIYCEHCGELITMYDTDKGAAPEWMEARCGEKVCDFCCGECYATGGCECLTNEEEE